MMAGAGSFGSGSDSFIVRHRAILYTAPPPFPASSKWKPWQEFLA
jgi:hypothetical protein